MSQNSSNTKSAAPSKEIATDVVLIGAGPVGLFAVFELGILNMQAHVIDILPRAGGQCSELYPEKPIYDIPGLPVVSGQELTDRLLQQIAPFKPQFHFNQMVTELTQLNDRRWRVRTDGGQSFTAPVVVIAAGGGSFQPKKPPIPGIERFEGKGVAYAVRQLEALRGQEIVISGGGDSALDWVLTLAPLAKKLTLVHRRDAFRAAPDSVAKMRALLDKGEIEFHLGQIAALDGGSRLDAVQLKTPDGALRRIACTAFLPFFGLTMKLGPLADWGIQLHENLIPVNTEDFATDRPGLYAIGDINHYAGKLKLILCGFHESALMAQSAFRRVFPGEKLLFQYTTSSTSLQKKLGVA